MTYLEFFRQAMRSEKTPGGLDPFPYQSRLAQKNGDWPDLLDVPTGLGKTAAVVLAWLYKRIVIHDPKTPRRLVYCLPMRVLVEQTYENAIGWLDRLGLLAGKDECEDVGNERRLKSDVARPEEDKLMQSGWATQQGLTGSPIAVHLLMGGAERTDWITWPERDAILIGTQDMLLSRALNRGYAAGRARWPMDFGLLNNGCLWVFDEVQLMSTGLATSLQLDAWRKLLQLRGDNGFPKDTKDPVASPCRSLWMSATTARHWLDSAVDWRSYAEKAWETRHRLTDADLRHGRVRSLFANEKTVKDQSPVATLEKPRTQEGKPDKGDAKAETNTYISELATAVEEGHSKEGLTLVILNTVERAVDLYTRLHERKNLAGVDVRLIHSRFREIERKTWKPLFSNGEQRQRIIISTQVVEAGVDVSAEVLFTELAPWAALVQRFGRCARFPEQNGTIFWMDIDLGTEKQPNDVFARPYERAELVSAKERLNKLSDVGLERLKEIKEELDTPTGSTAAKNLFPYDPRFVPRDKDLFDLFDTTPDLTGADVDISRYIRDGRELDVQVFWREVDEEPNKRDRPDRRELCPVAFYRFREQISGLSEGGRLWRWNYRKGWEPLSADQAELIYPGQVFLLEKTCGGYDRLRGWTGDPKSQDFELLKREQQPDPDDMPNKLAENDAEEDGEPLSQLRGWVKLSDHSRHVWQHMDGIGKELLAESEREVPKLAARWHDRGKAHKAFVANLKPQFLEQAQKDALILGDQPAAKAPKEAWQAPLGRRAGKHDADETTASRRRPGFRHELASALAILETLRQADSKHRAFAWPEGLPKSQFGQPYESEQQRPSTGPAAQELAALSREDFDLVLYLVAAHHGKVRMSLRSSPDDARTDVPDPCPSSERQARGVRDNDELEACKLPDENGKDMEAPRVTLSLDPMELGLSARYGPSWRERMQELLERLGPFRLAYLEALLRVADWRASRNEDENARKSE